MVGLVVLKGVGDCLAHVGECRVVGNFEAEVGEGGGPVGVENSGVATIFGLREEGGLGGVEGGHGIGPKVGGW